MKQTILVILFSFLVAYTKADVPAEIIKSYQNIIRLIKEDKIDELSKLIVYPLPRQNPLPNILTPKEFIAQYHVLFDDAFKKKLKLYNDSDVFEHHGMYGLGGGPFSGEIWLDENGKMVALNYSSKQEQTIKNQLTKKIQANIYPTVNTWNENIIVCKSESLLIRIDDTKQGIRYVSWSKSHDSSQKPDMILYNGKEEFQGTEGGVTWTFKNGDWTYVVDDVEMAETEEQTGLFLELSYKDIMKQSIRLKEIK